MGCGELLSYVEQFGEDGIRGLVLVDGLIPANKNPEIVSTMYDWLIQLQRDRDHHAADLEGPSKIALLFDAPPFGLTSCADKYHNILLLLRKTIHSLGV
jgi:hypothetical protein